MQKFPHLPEQIFQKLNNESLFKSREVARSWKYLINERNYPWICVVNIPSILQERNAIALPGIFHQQHHGKIQPFATCLETTAFAMKSPMFQCLKHASIVVHQTATMSGLM